MSFYLTLPSNASYDIYPNNSQSDYSTQLNFPLELDDNYEVALTEFFCSNRISVILCKLEFPHPYFNQFMINLDIEVENRHEQTTHLIDEINEKIKTLILPDLKLPQNVDTVTILSKTGIIPKERTVDELINLKLIPQFKFEDSNLELIYENSKNLTIEGSLSYILFGKYKSSTKTSVKTYFQSLLSNFTQYAAIYIDIIKDQIVGDSTAPILQIINFSPSKNVDHIHVFENPHYIPVNKKLISTINIRLLDLQGNQIKFIDVFSFTILKLHFRKIKNNE